MKSFKYILSLLFVFLGFFSGDLKAETIIIENESVESFSEQDFSEVSEEKEWLGLLYFQEEPANQNQYLLFNFLNGSLAQNFSGELCPKIYANDTQSSFQSIKKSESHQENGGRIKPVFFENPDLVDAWRYVSDLKPSGTSKLTQDVDFLQVVNRQRANSDLINKIGSDKYDDIIKNYAGQCKGCDAPASSASEAVKHLPSHDEMLESLEAFTTKHHGKDGFDKVINDLKSTDPRKQKGAEFVSRILKDQDGISAFEFKYLDDLDNTADFVLNGKNIDGKSWSVASSIDNIGNWNLSGQLKDYFKSDKVFEQWFDYSRFQKSANGTYSSMSKTDAVEHIKKQYQKLFLKESKAQELFDHMGETRFRELFGNDIRTVDDFIDDVVSDLSNSDLYGFIKVK